MLKGSLQPEKVAASAYTSKSSSASNRGPTEFHTSGVGWLVPSLSGSSSGHLLSAVDQNSLYRPNRLYHLLMLLINPYTSGSFPLMGSEERHIVRQGPWTKQRSTSHERID